MKYAFYVLILFSLFSGRICSAANTIPTENDIRELKLMLAVNSHLITFASEVAEANGKSVITDVELENKLRTTTQKILSEYDPQNKQPKLMARVWNILKSLNWKNLLQFVKGHAQNAKKLFRKDGSVIGVAFALGVVLEIAVPAALIKAGVPALVAISPFIPYEIILIAPANAAKKQWMELQIQKIYGGRENYLQAKRGFEEARKELRMGAAKDIVYPMMEGTVASEAAVISSAGFIRKLLNKIGISSKRLSFESLDSFLKEENIQDPLIEALRQNKSLDSQIKAVLLMRYIANHPDKDLLAKVKTRFSASFTSASVHELPKELHDSIKKLAIVSSIEEALVALRSLLEGLPAKPTARFVEQIFVPFLIENVSDIRARQISTLKKWSHALIAKAKANPEASWKQIWTEPELASQKDSPSLAISCASALSRVQ